VVFALATGTFLLGTTEFIDRRPAAKPLSRRLVNAS
jgi:hypothetical protein